MNASQQGRGVNPRLDPYCAGFRRGRRRVLPPRRDLTVAAPGVGRRYDLHRLGMTAPGRAAGAGVAGGAAMGAGPPSGEAPALLLAVLDIA